VYITDMYHGIIQVGNFAGPGTYLRARVQQYDLDKIIHKGRIWRLVYDGVKPDRSDAMRRDRIVPRMNNETPAQLVRHLSHPNGWWRDTAQQLLVLKQDKTVVPALLAIVKTSPNLLARFHAMWTLEGLDSLKPALVRQLMEDTEPRMRIQAIRASETLYKAGERSLAADYARMANDPNVDVVLQALLTMNRWNVPDADKVIKATMAGNQARGVQLVGTTLLNPPAGRGGGGRGVAALSPEQQSALQRGATIYNELCFACHAPDGMGTPRPEISSTMAPPLAGSQRVNGHRDYIVKAILGGITGPVDGKTYTDMMIPMANQDDEWIAAVASYVRYNFGNSGGYVTPADVARVRAANADRKSLWTIPELMASLPTPLLTDGWKLSASHHEDAAIGALSLTTWNAGAQQAGMWFQIELPKPEMVTEIQFQSPPPGGRGGGGRAAAVTSSGAPVVAAPGFPRGYQVEVSQDGSTWTPVAKGEGAGLTTISTFQPVQAKFVRISLTTTVEDAPAWSIQNLRLFALGAKPSAAR